MRQVRRHRPDRLRQLGRDRILGRPERRGVRRLHRPPGPQRHRRREPHHLRRARRHQHVRRRRADVRRDVAGLQHLRRQQPLHVRRPVPARQPDDVQGGVRGVLQPAVEHGGGRRRALRAVQRRRVPDDPLARAQRLQRQLPLGRRHEQQPGAAAPAPAVPLERARRVLVGGAAGEHGGGARRRHQPGLLLRQHGLLEDPLRPEPVRAADAGPDADVLQGHALHAADGPADVHGHLARPAVHDRGERAEAGERAERPVVPRQRRHDGDHGAVRLQEPAPVAQHRRPRRSRPVRRCSSRPARSATSGTSTPTTASGPRARSSSPRRPPAASRCSPTTAAPSSRTAPPRTT